MNLLPSDLKFQHLSFERAHLFIQSFFVVLLVLTMNLEAPPGLLTGEVFVLSNQCVEDISPCLKTSLGSGVLTPVEESGTFPHEFYQKELEYTKPSKVSTVLLWMTGCLVGKNPAETRQISIFPDAFVKNARFLRIIPCWQGIPPVSIFILLPINTHLVSLLDNSAYR